MKIKKNNEKFENQSFHHCLKPSTKQLTNNIDLLTILKKKFFGTEIKEKWLLKNSLQSQVNCFSYNQNFIFLKKVVINPIFDDLKSKLWWEYTKYDQSSKEIIDNFFATYSKDLPPLLTSNLYENVNTLSKLMGIYTHPLFKAQPKYSIFEENAPILQSTTMIEGQPANNLQPTNILPSNLVASTNNIQASQTNLAPPENTTKIDPNFIIISNMKVDYATVKILNFIWGLSKFNVLK